MNERDLMARVVEAAEALFNTRIIPAEPAAEDALDVLRQRLETLQHYWLHGNEADRPPRAVRVKSCERCQAPFFFARWGPVGGNWIPFELDPISCEGVLQSWLWTVDFSGAVPIAIPCPTMTRGQVWVDHRQTCGTGDGPNHRCVPYLRRWKVNVARFNAETDNASVRATNDLLALQRRLRGDDMEA